MSKNQDGDAVTDGLGGEETWERVRDGERESDGASLQGKRAAARRRAGIRESA